MWRGCTAGERRPRGLIHATNGFKIVLTGGGQTSLKSSINRINVDDLSYVIWVTYTSG